MLFFMISVAILTPCAMVAMAEAPQTAAKWDFEDAAEGKLPKGWTAAKTGEGEGSVWKIVEDSDGNTYRAVYTAVFPEVVYVLDAFVKKSKSGIKTPQADKDRVRDRFKAAKRDYDEHARTHGGT